MPNVPMGADYGGFGNVAAQLEQERQGRVALAQRQQQLNFQENQAVLQQQQAGKKEALNEYLKSRGLAIEEMDAETRQDKVAADIYSNTVNAILKKNEQEAKQREFDLRFGLESAAKEATLGIRYDPVTRKATRVEPGQGLYTGTSGKPDYQMAKFLQQEYHNLNSRISENDRRIEIVTADMGDTLKIIKGSPEYNRLSNERQKRTVDRLSMQKERDLLKARWQTYIGPQAKLEELPASEDILAPGQPTETVTVGEQFPGPAEPPVSLVKQATAVLTKAGESPSGKQPPAIANWNDRIISSLDAVKSSISQVPTQNRYPSPSMAAKQYSTDDLELVLDSLTQPEIRKRLTDLGLDPDRYRVVIIEALRKQGKNPSSYTSPYGVGGK